MISFFHHYELPALLEQIRLQQQQQQVPPHQDPQAANGHMAPDINAQASDDADQSGGGRPDDAEVEPQVVGVTDATEVDRVTAATDDPSHQMLSVDHSVRGHSADPVQCSLQELLQVPVPDNVGFVDEAAEQSAALTLPTSTSSSFHSATLTSEKDNDCGSYAVSTEETHVRQRDLSSSSHEMTGAELNNAAHVGGLVSQPAAADSSVELRRRYQASDSASPSNSYTDFTS